MGNNVSIPTSLPEARMRALNFIRRKLADTWDHLTLTKYDYLVEQTSTKDNASALHALFGTENSLGYIETDSTKRGLICKSLQSANYKDDWKARKYLRMSLQQYFEEDDTKSNKKKLPNTDSSSFTPNLDKYSGLYISSKEDIGTTFPWDSLLSDKQALKEYFHFLSEPNIPFLVSDLQLIAHISDIPIRILDDEFRPLKVDECMSDINESTVLILLNDSCDPFEFSRVTPCPARDQSLVNTQILAILNEIYLLSDTDEIETYLAVGDFAVTEMDMLEEVDGQDHQEKLFLIQQILAGMDDDDKLSHGEKLRIQMTLLEIPAVCLRVLVDRIEMTCREVAATSFNAPAAMYLKHVLREIKEFILESETSHKSPSELLIPVVWAIGSYPPEEWFIEVGIIKLEETFAGVVAEDIKMWRQVLKEFPKVLALIVLQLVGDDDDDDDEKPDSYFGRRDKNQFNKFIKSIKDLQINLHECDANEFTQLIHTAPSRWPLQLPKIYISSLLSSLPGDPWDSIENKRAQALYHLYSLYNLKPVPTLQFLQELKKALKRGGGGDALGNEIAQIITKLSGGYWDLGKAGIELLRNSPSLEEWILEMTKAHSLAEWRGDGQRTLHEISQIIEDDGNSSLSSRELERIKELVEEVDTYKIPNVDKFRSYNLKSLIKAWLSDFKKRMNFSSSKDHTECLAYVNLAMKINLKFKDGLRPNQKFAVVAALYLGSLNRSLLSQMATGQGKTCVVLALSIIRGIFGQKCDIVTSSEVLAKRDAAVYKSLFEIFGLTVGEVTSLYEHIRRSQYRCDVVYGTSTCFQGDYIRDLFYQRGTRGNREYTNVIVDEVDTMLLDNGRGVVYLSHDPADMNSLEDVLIFIWTNVVAAVNSRDFHHVEIHEKVMSEIYPTLAKSELEELSSDPEKNEDLWDFLIQQNIINEWGRLLTEDKSVVREKLEKLPDSFANVKKQLIYLIESCLEGDRRIEVMEHLKPLVDRNLYEWIDNAFWATQYTEGVQYVVDVSDHSDESTEDKNIHAKITPVNLYTGVDQANTTWSDGLHQFLQLKHGCKLGTVSTIGIFISGITYFKLYPNKFGLTGTMGTPSDRKFLAETYNVDFLSVPSSQAKRFVEEEPIICRNEQNWKEEIYKDVIDKTVDQGRSVLIICQFVKDAEKLYNYHKEMGVDLDTIQLYTRDHQKFKAAQVKEGLPPGQILIATNLAGRGTDIKLSTKLRDAGGLHVIPSYLPDNLRVEQQAFGRVARSDEPGTGRMIFYKCGSNPDTNAIDLKIARDEEESRRVANINEFYETYILKKEQMFDSFKKSYQALNDAMQKSYGKKKDYAPMKKIILDSMVDKWAFWLDKYSFFLESKKKKDAVQMMNRGKIADDLCLNEDHLKKELMQMISRYDVVKSVYEDDKELLKEKESRGLSVVEEPGLMVKAAKIFIERGIGFRGRFIRSEVERALEYIDKVLRNNKNLLPAMYYKLHCKLRLGKWQTSEFDRLAEEVLTLLDGRQEKLHYFLSMVSQIKCITSESIVKKEGYQNQKENEIKIINVFKGSIDRMIGNGKLCVGQDFGGLKDIRKNPEIAEHLEKFLVNKGALLEPEFQFYGVNDRDAKLKKLADQFFMQPEEVQKIIRDLHGREISNDVLKNLKKNLDLPYKGGFWNEIEGCLHSPQSFALVKHGQNALEKSSPKKEGSCQKNDFANDWLPKFAKPSGKVAVITKYGMNQSSASTMASVNIGSKSDFKSQQKYKYLRKKGRLCYETAAVLKIDSLKKLKLSKFFKVCRNAFTRIDGLEENESSRIFDILVEKNVIDVDGELLSTEWTKDGDNKLDLTVEFEVYRADILSILQNSCRYKYEVLSILQQLEESEKESAAESFVEVRFSLPAKPWHEFVATAIELGFVKGLRPSASYFVGYGGIEVFQEPKKWYNWVAGKIGEPMNKQEDTVPTISYWDLRTLFPDDDAQFLLGIRDEIQGRKWLLTGENIPEEVNTKYEYYLPEIITYAQWIAAKDKGELVPEALKQCFEAQGKLKILDNPDAQLNPLEEYFGTSDHEKKQYEEEISTFEMGGFDDVIDTVERKYTWKMIGSAILCFLMGLVQVVIGVVITFFTMGAGTFIGSAFIQEGIGDMIYSGMAFWSGTFSWQDYINYKWQSVAITAATMGFASLLSKARYSKYGVRLFGAKGANMSGRVIQETLKSGANSGVRRSIWKMLAKSVGYKILQSGALAAGNMAVSYAYENVLSKAVNELAKEIFAKMYKTAHESIDRRLKDDIYVLCDKLGSFHQAGKILTECLAKAMSDSKYFNEENIVHNLISIQRVAWGGISEATGKAASAGAMSGKNAAAILMIGKITSGVMAVTAVANSLNSLGDNVDKLIQGVQIELKSRIDGLKEETVESMNAEAKKKFVEDFKKAIDKILNERLEHVMRYQVIEPLMNMGCQKLLNGLGRSLRGACKELREGWIRKEIRKTVEAKNNTNSQNEKIRLNKKLIKLGSKARDPKTLAFAVENGVALGPESLQVLANWKGVRIVVKSDNNMVSDVIEPENGNAKTTLYMKHTPPTDPSDLGHWESSTGAENRNNRGQSGNPDCLLNAFNEELRRCGQPQTCVNREGLARQMRSDVGFREYVKNGYHHSFNAIGGFGGARKSTFRVSDVELHGEERDLKQREIMNFREELERDGKIRKVEGSSPIQEKVTSKRENRDGKEVEILVFQSGEVKPEHLTNLPNRPGDNITTPIIQDQDPDSCDQAGHYTPHSQRGPAEDNMYPQHPTVNMGVGNAIDRKANKFLRENEKKGLNPSVRYKIKPVYGDSLRPTETLIYQEFRLNGKLYKTDKFDGVRVIKLPNPRSSRRFAEGGSTPHPPRKGFLKRGRG